MDKRLTRSPSTPLRVTIYLIVVCEQILVECHPERSRRATRQQGAAYEIVSFGVIYNSR
jgi:hypothetical protein